MWFVIRYNDRDILHYGMPMRSGRYPYGSGNRPYQHTGNGSKLSRSIHSNAIKREPAITRDIKYVAGKNNVSLYGLDHRLKHQSSIKRKIHDDSLEKNISLDEAAQNVKDAVRYTMLFSEDDFVSKYNKIKMDLQKLNYEETRCKNYFDMYNKGIVKHKSVQSQFKDPDGYQFEIQFHTKSSQDIKNKKVKLYEEVRRYNVNEQRRNKIEMEMERLAESIKDPKNISKIKSYN